MTEKPVTSQQARNIVRRLEGKKKTEEEKIMHEVGREEGNDVTNWISRLPLYPSRNSTQKSFELWGDCLLMYWTHGTNNLGYHLGLHSSYVRYIGHTVYRRPTGQT
ncbi:hypothetical protein GQ600_4001 [Phytophthora cactorum]|nr:hypothetical protein GQ600_4001 [Phytophthora cactorum]